jgi:hypothetical protein
MAVATLFPLVRTVGQHGAGGEGKPLRRLQVVEERPPFVPVTPVRNDELSKCEHGVHWPKNFAAADIFCTLCSQKHISHLLSLDVDPRGTLRFAKPRNQVAYANGHTHAQVCPECNGAIYYVPDGQPDMRTCADCEHTYQKVAVCQ